MHTNKGCLSRFKKKKKIQISMRLIPSIQCQCCLNCTYIQTRVSRAAYWVWKRSSPSWRLLLKPPPVSSACRATKQSASLWWSVWRWWVSLLSSCNLFVMNRTGQKWDAELWFYCTTLCRLSWCRRPWMRRGLMKPLNCVEGESFDLCHLIVFIAN